MQFDPSRKRARLVVRPGRPLLLDEVSHCQQGESVRVYGRVEHLYRGKEEEEEGECVVITDSSGVQVHVQLDQCKDVCVQCDQVYMVIGEIVQGGGIRARVFTQAVGFDKELYQRTVRVIRVFGKFNL
jgi:hypothetical protein